MGDLIDREDAIDVIKHVEVDFTVKSAVDFSIHQKAVQEIIDHILDAQEKGLMELPSAEPEPCEDAVSREMSDLISRQAAIDAINEIRGTMNMVADIVADKYLIDAQNNIRLLPPVQPKFKAIANIQLTQEQVDKAFERAKEDILSVQPEQQWIPCSERLPEERQWVLCQCRAKQMDVLRINSDHEWEQLYPRTTYMSGFVIAWMPLPEQYVPDIDDGTHELFQREQP